MTGDHSVFNLWGPDKIIGLHISWRGDYTNDWEVEDAVGQRQWGGMYGAPGIRILSFEFDDPDDMREAEANAKALTLPELEVEVAVE